MADLDVRVRFDDTGISTATSAAHPILKRIEDHLYICAPAGMIRTTDKIKFARYVSSNKRQRHKRKVHKKVSGWLRPQKRGGGTLVPLRLELDKTKSNINTEYWCIIVNKAIQDNISGEQIDTKDIALCLYHIEIFSASSATTRKSNQGRIIVNLGTDFCEFFGRKLGVCIERNGVQITDYMPFGATIIFTKANKDGEYSVISREVLSIYHAPVHLTSLEQAARSSRANGYIEE